MKRKYSIYRGLRGWVVQHGQVVIAAGFPKWADAADYAAGDYANTWHIRHRS